MTGRVRIRSRDEARAFFDFLSSRIKSSRLISA